jgi:hypothetical protein
MVYKKIIKNMKYLKKRDPFLDSIKEVNKDILIENLNYHKTEVKNLGEVDLPNPKFGDLKLSVMPFENNGKWISLPDGFKLWEESFNEILKHIPLQEDANTHYVTIDTKFFTIDEYLRREGVHIDGNFCVDPYFISSSVNEMASWGGASYNSSWGGAKFTPVPIKTSWGGAGYSPEKSSWGGAKSSSYIKPKIEKGEDGKWRVTKAFEGFEEKSDNSHVKMDWVLPYDIVIPISEYVSSTKGGILTVSTEVGCQAWHGEFFGEVLSEGAFTNMEDQLTDDKKIVFEKNQLYFMSSNTPHETLLINKGKRRTFLRITLNHNYDNSLIK